MTEINSYLSCVTSKNQRYYNACMPSGYKATWLRLFTMSVYMPRFWSRKLNSLSTGCMHITIGKLWYRVVFLGLCRLFYVSMNYVTVNAGIWLFVIAEMRNQRDKEQKRKIDKQQQTEHDARHRRLHEKCAVNGIEWPRTRYTANVTGDENKGRKRNAEARRREVEGSKWETVWEI